MDADEATRVVFSRIEGLDNPENVAKIMGLLLGQDHSDKEMIRLAFGPEALLQSVVVKARKELGLHPSSSSAATSDDAPFPSLLAPKGSSSSRLLDGAFGASTSLAPPSFFSNTNNVSGAVFDLESAGEFLSQRNPAPSPLCGDCAVLGDEFPLEEQLPSLYGAASTPIGSKSDQFHPDFTGDCRSPSRNVESFLPPYPMSCGSETGQLRRSSSDDTYFGGDNAWRGCKPCAYFARGYCKNGHNCRFLHPFTDHSVAIGEMTAALEKRCRALLQQQNESQRSVASATAAAPTQGEDENQTFMSRPWTMERIASPTPVVNPHRRIFLKFLANNTFTEEDLYDYFSNYGAVQDVRIPYQQKGTFGFVTFIHAKTVKLVLSKGNPHIVCGVRVFVKRYKVPDKHRKQHQPEDESFDFSGRTAPTALDSGDSFDFPQLAGLQQVINQRFMDLQLMDLNNSNQFDSSAINTQSNTTLQEEFACLVEPLQCVAEPSAANTTNESTSKEEIDSGESMEHNPPDSLFKSPNIGDASSAAVYSEDNVMEDGSSIPGIRLAMELLKDS
ncbi:zinc finger CCCH domain-containing protein 53-like isoform X1 [Canna indica]|uniref:Zinc finger CCCH domain-containing protein 53-like isoform X1 n=1 Tax=Canna indica TaxID=4628 RepID=A0AAQ3KW77_9LILI|nr:zinc finger CCCH domain-containing protein 53-like isoform X1 [Canna indica]